MTKTHDTATDRIHRATAAFDMLDRMTAKCDCPADDTFCIHFLAAAALRELLIDRNAHHLDDTYDADDSTYDFIRSLLDTIIAAPYQTQRLSMLALDHSLCPMHFIDYAICFDDDDDECATIRAYFPDHDT